MIIGDIRSSLLLFFAAVGLVTLLVCANTTHLLLGRATARQHEFAIRAALGANRGQLVRQMLIESLLLSTVAGVLGVFIASIAVPLLLHIQAAHLPRLAPSASLIDARVIFFTFITSTALAITFGIVPALSVSRPDIDVELRSGARAGTGPRHHRTRIVLLITEMAVANLLVIAAVLLVRSLAALYSVDPGFDRHNVVTLKTAFADPRFATTPGTMRVIDAGFEQITRLPGIESAAVSLTGVPLEQGGALRVDIPGRTLDRQYVESWAAVTPGYFDVFKIPVIRGRAFTDRDRSGNPPIAIINETMARQLWPDRDPLHDRLLIGRGGGPAFDEGIPREIIGIVGDVPQTGLGRRPAPGMYVPVAQMKDELAAFFSHLDCWRHGSFGPDPLQRKSWVRSNRRYSNPLISRLLGFGR
jgi:predicted permease